MDNPPADDAVTIDTVETAAQTPNDDVQAWPSVVVTASVGDRFEVRADGLLQVTNDVSRVGRELLRVVVLGVLNERLAPGGGYPWTRVGDLAGNQQDGLVWRIRRAAGRSAVRQPTK